MEEEEEEELLSISLHSSSGQAKREVANRWKRISVDNGRTAMYVLVEE